MSIVNVKLEGAKAAILAAMPANADRERIVRGLAGAAMSKWKKLAQKRLKSSRKDYIKGLEHKIENGVATISLNGVIPNMIENGWPGGDMREWMLKSPKAKQGVNGPYLVIPFRHGTPGTTGANVGPTMPDTIYGVAQKLEATIKRPGKRITEGGGGDPHVYGKRLHPGLPMKTAARKVLNRIEKPWHATGIYMHMIRKGQHTVNKDDATSGYTTFRTISRNKKTGKDAKTGEMRTSWTHPGIRGRQLAVEVQKHIEKIAKAIVVRAVGDKPQTGHM